MLQIRFILSLSLFFVCAPLSATTYDKDLHHPSPFCADLINSIRSEEIPLDLTHITPQENIGPEILTYEKISCRDDQDYYLIDITQFRPTEEFYTKLAIMHTQAWKESYTSILNNKKLEENCKSISYIFKKTKEHKEYIHNSQEDNENKFCYVLFNNRKIVGFCKFGESRIDNGYNITPETDGEIYTLYLLDEVKGCGLGSQLWNIVCEKMRALGWTTAKVWTLENNETARSFYEYKGGELCGRKEINIFGDQYPEVCYGFSLQ